MDISCAAFLYFPRSIYHVYYDRVAHKKTGMAYYGLNKTRRNTMIMYTTYQTVLFGLTAISAVVFVILIVRYFKRPPR